MLVGGRFGEGVGSGKVSNGCNGCVKQSIYESFLSIVKKIIIVHNFDCIKSRIPEEVASYSSGNLWDFARNH